MFEGNDKFEILIEKSRAKVNHSIVFNLACQSYTLQEYGDRWMLIRGIDLTYLSIAIKGRCKINTLFVKSPTLEWLFCDNLGLTNINLKECMRLKYVSYTGNTCNQIELPKNRLCINAGFLNNPVLNNSNTITLDYK